MGGARQRVSRWHALERCQLLVCGGEYSRQETRLPPLCQHRPRLSGKVCGGGGQRLRRVLTAIKGRFRKGHTCFSVGILLPLPLCMGGGALHGEFNGLSPKSRQLYNNRTTLRSHHENRNPKRLSR